MNKLILFGLLIFISSCNKNDNDIDNKAISLSIPSKWILVDLINKSDKDKYINTKMDFNLDNNYLITKTNNDSINGIFNLSKDNKIITLTPGLFRSTNVDYEILSIDSDTLKLQEHYTLDSKDSYIQYYFKKDK